MTKKELKKKCKENREISYKLNLAGGIISVIGVIIVVLTILILKRVPDKILGFAIGGSIAFIGMCLDLVGEFILAKKYKECKEK